MKTLSDMMFALVGLLLLTSLNTAKGIEDFNDNNEVGGEVSHNAYNTGVSRGIINPEKYPFETFLRDEQNVFRDLYNVYISSNGSHPFNYEEWLVVNNFGILADTQESLFARKITKRSTADNKRSFVSTVRKGDILIVNRGEGGLVGHAAIMTTDYWVLELPGGRGWQNGIPDNNRQVPKADWFDNHASDWTTVYRCPDSTTASMAANWADQNYYNPTGGATKTKHITYKLTKDIWSRNPSYSSKLVIHAYYFGTGSRQVIRDLSTITDVIGPSSIPSYFLSPYRLVNIGRY